MQLRRHIKNYQLETKIFRQRLLKASIIIAVLIGILLLRLAYLQISQHKYYDQLATHNQLEIFSLEPNRGLIYDRNGVLLAENTPIFTLAIIPDYISDVSDTLTELSKIISFSDDDLNQFYKVLKQHQKFEHVPLKYKLTQDELEIFYANQFRFPGVTIDANMIRHYPLGDALANIIGYVGKINSQDIKNIDISNYINTSFIGKIGIEKYYEKNLRGKIGYQHVEIDAAGHIIRQLQNINPTPGDNLYLTIDSKLQIAAQKALGDERGSVVIIDPNNGEILALASNPSYDPNLFAYGIDVDNFQKLQTSPDKPMYNRAIRGIFPFGSTIKPFLALEALDSNTISPNFSIADPGWFKLPNSNYKYRDWQVYGHGTVNISKAIMVSCDTFFYTLATKLGIEKMDNILNRFGFGQKVGIDLNEEISGLVASPKWKINNLKKSWYLGDTVQSGIGQGFMSTTPLQLATATATLATRGVRQQSHLLLKLVEPMGTNVTLRQAPLSPIILKSKQTWDIVINAMKNVTSSPMGTAYAHFGANLPYTVAGKTGTAQLSHHHFNEENATFETGNITKRLRNHSLFIAFAPIDNPKIAMAVVVENSVAAPIVARKILDYYFIPEAQQTPVQIATQKSEPKKAENNEDNNNENDNSTANKSTGDSGATINDANADNTPTNENEGETTTDIN